MDASYPRELEDVMHDILEKCGGLPLAIVSIASVLSGYTSPGSREKWETLGKSIRCEMDNNPTIEEGLILEKQGFTLMEVAESYLDELVRRNMIEPVRASDIGKAESYRVSGMILELMVSKAQEANFVSLLGRQYTGMLYDRVRRLSIHSSVENLADSPIKKQTAKRDSNVRVNVRHVRSLSVFVAHGDKLLDRLHNFILLRVLDLANCEVLTNGHLDCVCRMYLLKFLSVKGTNISKMPPEVGKLEDLQMFDVRDTCLPGLPETVTKLHKVENLKFSNRHGWHTMWRLPRGLKKMKELREVAGAVLGNDIQVARELGELEQLQQLDIYINSSPEPSKEVLREFANSLSKAYSLRHLNLGATGYGQVGVLNFLHDLTAPPPLLRYIRISGCIDGGLPGWIMSLTYLVEFHMAWGGIVGDQLYDVLSWLPHLETIGVERKCYNDNELVARAYHEFPSLVNLNVTSDAPLPKVFKFEERSMPKLETLLVNFADKEEKSIVGIEHLHSLKEVKLTGKKDNRALNHALEELNVENQRRSSSSQFRVVVRYE
ncbi:hypothetical protein EJB05_15319, partial [Eragrostis curvula]